MAEHDNNVGDNPCDDVVPRTPEPGQTAKPELPGFRFDPPIFPDV